MIILLVVSIIPLQYYRYEERSRLLEDGFQNTLSYADQFLREAAYEFIQLGSDQLLNRNSNYVISTTPITCIQLLDTEHKPIYTIGSSNCVAGPFTQTEITVEVGLTEKANYFLIQGYDDQKIENQRSSVYADFLWPLLIVLLTTFAALLYFYFVFVRKMDALVNRVIQYHSGLPTRPRELSTSFSTILNWYIDELESTNIIQTDMLNKSLKHIIHYELCMFYKHSTESAPDPLPSTVIDDPILDSTLITVDFVRSTLPSLELTTFERIDVAVAPHSSVNSNVPVGKLREIFKVLKVIDDIAGPTVQHNSATWTITDIAGTQSHQIACQTFIQGLNQTSVNYLQNILSADCKEIINIRIPDQRSWEAIGHISKLANLTVSICLVSNREQFVLIQTSHQSQESNLAKAAHQ